MRRIRIIRQIEDGTAAHEKQVNDFLAEINDHDPYPTVTITSDERGRQAVNVLYNERKETKFVHIVTPTWQEFQKGEIFKMAYSLKGPAFEHVKTDVEKFHNANSFYLGTAILQERKDRHEFHMIVRVPFLFNPETDHIIEMP